MKDTKKVIGFSLKEVIVIVIFSSLLTSLASGLIVYNQNKLTKNITYRDLNKDPALKEFLSVYASLIDQYYENVNKKEMLESAISAMFSYLGEDYSNYMSKEETDALAEKLMGEYKGIGIELNRENKTIVNFIQGSSAKEAGLEIGDEIVAVNKIEVQSIDEVVSILSKLNMDEKCIIEVLRNGERLSFEVTNKKIYTATQYKMLEDSIGYIKISTFSENLKEQFGIALDSLEKTGMQSLILDLRDNTGGFLSAAKDIASLFLENGKAIYSLEDKEGVETFYDETMDHRNYKLILLQNEGSASASEVLIAALKESYGAILVGTQSYGKGKVQQTHSLEDGSMIKYTSAKWLTPTGNCIDKIGISPDYHIENDQEDLQLAKAVELAK